MLYIFSQKNGVQIAWNSKVPARRSNNRAEELDIRNFGPLGFIRTSSIG